MRKGELLTEWQLRDKEWAERLEATYEISERMFFDYRAEAKKKIKGETNFYDELWYILNQLIVKYMRTSDWQRLAFVYRDMVDVAKIEKRNFKKFEEQAVLANLNSYKYSGITRVRVETVNDEGVCAQCAQMAGKTFSIDTAISDLPVPRKCTCTDGCRCHYAPIFDT